MGVYRLTIIIGARGTRCKASHLPLKIKNPNHLDFKFFGGEFPRIRRLQRKSRPEGRLFLLGSLRPCPAVAHIVCAPFGPPSWASAPIHGRSPSHSLGAHSGSSPGGPSVYCKGVSANAETPKEKPPLLGRLFYWAHLDLPSNPRHRASDFRAASAPEPASMQVRAPIRSRRSFDSSPGRPSK